MEIFIFPNPALSKPNVLHTFYLDRDHLLHL